MQNIPASFEIGRVEEFLAGACSFREVGCVLLLQYCSLSLTAGVPSFL